ncbi:MAG: hypothetical protein AABX03_05140 [Nanoarchaeota archaeon]|mgnify:CR=1 FL=1
MKGINFKQIVTDYVVRNGNLTASGNVPGNVDFKRTFLDYEISFDDVALFADSLGVKYQITNVPYQDNKPTNKVVLADFVEIFEKEYSRESSLRQTSLEQVAQGAMA